MEVLKSERNDGTIGVKDAAAALRVSVRHVRNMADNGMLPSWRQPGGLRRRQFLVKDVLALAADHGIPINAKPLPTMKIHEALTLCREHHCKVRPVAWGRDKESPWIEFVMQVFVKKYPNGEATENLLMTVENTMGPWEVVP